MKSLSELGKRKKKTPIARANNLSEVKKDTVEAFRKRRDERLKARKDSFPDHEGRKGQVGGSLPKYAGKAAEISQKVGFEVGASSAMKFDTTFHEIRDKLPPEDKWRVDGNYSANQYEEMECYNTPDGGSFAIHDGDIVSVCANRDGKIRGKQLLQAAVMAGGKKLDAFSGIMGFYLSAGFEPVSWCDFDVDVAKEYIKDWREGIDKEEPVVFYRHTGKTIPMEERQAYIERFFRTVPKSDDYEKAQKIRDDMAKEEEE